MLGIGSRISSLIDDILQPDYNKNSHLYGCRICDGKIDMMILVELDRIG